MCALLSGLLLTACDSFDNDPAPAASGKLMLHNDYYITLKNKGIQLNLTQNDTLGGSAIIQLSKPKYGTLQADSLQKYVYYQPLSNFTGIDTFSYQACLNNTCARAYVTIEVLNDSTQKPLCQVKAIQDQVSMLENKKVKINVLANDTTCGGSISIVRQPLNGKAVLNSNKEIEYTPKLNFKGTDQLEYTLSGATSVSKAVVSITVLPDSTLPPPCVVKAKDDAATLLENKTVVVRVLQNDSVCQALPMIVKQPQYGQATFNGNKELVYTPGYRYVGTDELEYQLTSAGGTAKAKVRFTILADPTLPPPCNVQAKPDSVLMSVQGDSVTINVLQNDVLCSTANPTVTLLTQPSRGNASLVQYSAGSRILYFKQTGNQQYNEVIQYRICQTVNGQVRCSDTAVYIFVR
ncbi:MAG: Ig-like domain-containing protein [Hymenobacteraceae bacterium]|nr:Ig-like domain-containing protein [Hymenobacteraceae bacterium]MDX5394561.1 Ig-like domain-containing protein [Hymenobacteraceae bacterium]MDX5443316.1 Ig-like domain-containing protein [Hymenobacteraceae bacterium]MDX5510582.1 Ig-like domain-containing protein [Hymenobacteraceae bacterium]